MGPPDLWYPPFIFEGQLVPTAHALPAALSERDLCLYWVRAAVSNPLFARAVISIADGWLEDISSLKRALSLHYLRALGARGSCERVSKALTQRPHGWLFIVNPLSELNEEASSQVETSAPEDGVSFFPPRKTYFFGAETRKRETWICLEIEARVTKSRDIRLTITGIRP